MIKVGINRIERYKGHLQGGKIVIYMKIYGTTVEINVIENISAVDIYNLVAA
jgi:hypothetical protein